jgi:transposase-like protein
MSGMPAPHPTEFRQRAVELARLGDTPVAQIAKDLGISESCLRNWMAQADADEKGSSTRLSTAEKKELAELRKRTRRLELENEILKRAAAYFARENILPK